MKAAKVIFWCAWFLFIALQEVRSQNPVSSQPPQHIVQQALRFADGHRISFRGRIKRAWMECYMFAGDIGYIFVDAITGQVTQAIYELPSLKEKRKEKRIELEEAEKRVKSWLMERGITLDGWTLEEQKTFDRGSPGKEHVFYWVKRSPKGVRLPCVLDVAIREDGAIRSFLRIERDTEVSLEPSIKAGEALKTAIKASGFTKAKVTWQELLVWFNEKGQQQLWWEMKLQEDTLQKTVIINAHTREVIAVFQPKGTPKETVEKKVSGILKDLKKVIKVEIIAYDPLIGQSLASPTKAAGAIVVGVIDAKKNPKTLRALLAEIEIMLKNLKPLLRLAVPLWLRLHLRDGKWIYHCKFHPKEGYFEFYTKEPWPQKLEGKLVRIIRNGTSTQYIYDWPPEGTVRIGISCQPTLRFTELIISSTKPDAQKALQKLLGR